MPLSKQIRNALFKNVIGPVMEQFMNNSSNSCTAGHPVLGTYNLAYIPDYLLCLFIVLKRFRSRPNSEDDTSAV